MRILKRITSYRAKIMLIYLLITMIPILVFMGVVQTQYVDRLRHQVLGSLENTTDAMVSTLDDCFVQIKNISNGLRILDETSKNYFPNKPAEANAFRDRLSVYISNSTLFDEIALYSPDNEYLFSNLSSYTIERFLQKKHLDYLSAEMIDKIIEESYGPVLLDSGGDVAFCVLYPIRIRSSTKALFFSFPVKKLNAQMSAALLNNDGYCQIMNHQSGVLHSYSTNGDSPNSYAIEQSLAGQQTVQSSGLTWYCASGTTTVANLAVSILISDGTLHESVASIGWSWGILILIAIVMCFFASWLSARINAKPVVKLSDKIPSDIIQREETFDEIEYIDKTINRLHDSFITAQKQMAELGDYLAFRLLCGNIENVEEANQLSKVLGSSIYAEVYQVCIVNINEEHSPTDAVNKIQSLLPPEISCLVRPSDSAYICLLFCGFEESNTVDVFCEKLLKYYQKAKISVGNGYSQFLDIPISFMEATLASKIEKSSIVSYYYKDEILGIIKNFREAIDANDIQVARDLLQQVYENLQTKPFEFQDIQCLCAHFTRILSESQLRENLQGVLPDVYILLSADSMEKLAKVMDPVVKELEGMCGANKNLGVSASLLDQMIEYLEKNYRNPNFSVQQMALDFYRTPTKISRYFKTHYGCNINDYINDLKINKAKQLLLETNLSVYEVGLELGYQGPNSFARRFKASCGMTPGEFRREG